VVNNEPGNGFPRACISKFYPSVNSEQVSLELFMLLEVNTVMCQLGKWES